MRTASTSASTSATDPDGSGVQDTGDELLTEDEVFHALGNQRRRLAIEYLRGRDGSVRMRDVAEQVAAWERDTTVERLTSEQRERVSISLHHNHLPKLDKLGVVDYDRDRGVVERRPPADRLTPHLGLLREGDDGESDDKPPVDGFSRGLPYLGVSGVGTLLVLGKAFGLPLVATTSNLLLSLTVVFLFALTSGLHLASQRGDDS